jgi:hypothetical protein
MPRPDFPGYSGEQSLQPIWTSSFEKFDERGLALLYQETAARRLSSETAEEKPKTRRAR